MFLSKKFSNLGMFYPSRIMRARDTRVF